MVEMATARFSFGRQSNWFILAITLLLSGSTLSQAQEAPTTPTMAPTPQLLPLPPSTPVGQGIQALIKTGMLPKLHWGQFSDYQDKLDALYQQTAYTPLWTREGKPTPQAKAAIASLAKADDKGLTAADYDAELLAKWLKDINSAASPSPQELAAFDVAASLSLMRYTSNLYKGRINPKRVNFSLDIEPKNEDLPALLRKIATSDNPNQAINEVEPKLKLYEYLKKALVRYRQLAKEAPATPVDLPNKFKPGDSDPNVPALRKILAVLGDLPEADPNDSSPLYDQALEDAVKNFQTRHGLTADGVIGKSTLAQLNVPLADRIRQIQLGLERLRWLPEHIDGRYLMVNIPSFQLFGFHNGSGSDRPDLEMNIIVGEAINGRNTPVFHSDMTYVNFRPYWNVPYKIAVKEYMPLALRHPGYLSGHNFEIVASFAPNAGIYAETYENIEALSSGELKLRQKPGPKNALGLIKFAFPNTNNVYLHSTPSQGLFKRTRRDFSHGCIRVEYPVKLAEFVFKDQDDWTAEKIEAAMQREKPRIVTLKTPIPVYIFYSTVLADENGRVMFYADIYGHDQILAEQLAKGFPYPP